MRAYRTMMAAMAARLLAAGCSVESPLASPPSASASQVASVDDVAADAAQEPAQEQAQARDSALDDGLPDTPEAYALQGKGRYDLWEDREGGRVCSVELRDVRTIGGYALEYQADCVEQLEVGGDIEAWLIDSDGDLVFIDAMRQPLLRLKRVEGGDYSLDRSGQPVESLVFSPHRDD